MYMCKRVSLSIPTTCILHFCVLFVKWNEVLFSDYSNDLHTKLSYRCPCWRFKHDSASFAHYNFSYKNIRPFARTAGLCSIYLQHSTNICILVQWKRVSPTQNFINKHNFFISFCMTDIITWICERQPTVHYPSSVTARHSYANTSNFIISTNTIWLSHYIFALKLCCSRNHLPLCVQTTITKTFSSDNAMNGSCATVSMCHFAKNRCSSSSFCVCVCVMCVKLAKPTTSNGKGHFS